MFLFHINSGSKNESVLKIVFFMIYSVKQDKTNQNIL